MQEIECQKCGDPIEAGEERDYAGRTLCEDCYMDTLSPAKGCDPWAAHSAKSFQNDPGGPSLNPVQQKILAFLQESGGVELPLIVERIQIKPSDLERELAALRHMEKIRAEMREGKKVIRIW